MQAPFLLSQIKQLHNKETVCRSFNFGVVLGDERISSVTPCFYDGKALNLPLKKGWS